MQLSHFFKDSQGKIVIAQWPNWPLWVVIVFYLVKYLPFSYAAEVSFWGVTAALLYWAYLEIVAGVNTWRKCLGLAVALGQIWKLIGRLVE